MAGLAESSSTQLKNDKPVVVRVKRKASQSCLDALWLEINETPSKRPLLGFNKLSISDSSKDEELKSKKVFVRHVETATTPDVSADTLQSFLTWTKLLDQSGFLQQPFTRQENTVIQTCAVASSGIAFSGGFGGYLFGMSQRVIEESEEGKTGLQYKNPSLGWMIGFLFVVSFLGLFSVVPLRKIMVIDFKLTYPSGTATAHLINSFHTPEGAKLAKKQVRALGKFFSMSFLWGFFQWFFTAKDDCGFANFPTFGLKAYDYKFFFDFSATYVGVGMICPHIINVSVLLGESGPTTT